MSEYICELEDSRYEMEWAPKEEIVRCRDCVYYDKYPNDKICVCYRFDNEQPIVEPGGYCAWAIRKERIEQ